MKNLSKCACVREKECYVCECMCVATDSKSNQSNAGKDRALKYVLMSLLQCVLFVTGRRGEARPGESQQ